MKKFDIALAILFISFFTVSELAYSNCQVPSGIYNDHARVVSMLEYAATVEKAMNQIVELKGKTMSTQKTNWCAG